MQIPDKFPIPGMEPCNGIGLPWSVRARVFRDARHEVQRPLSTSGSRCTIMRSSFLYHGAFFNLHDETFQLDWPLRFVLPIYEPAFYAVPD